MNTICEYCGEPIEDDLVNTARGPMHETCVDQTYSSYETTDHGDSIWPK